MDGAISVSALHRGVLAAATTVGADSPGRRYLVDGDQPGMVLLKGPLPMVLLWEIPLTYTVPFCVATWGALSNNWR